MLEASENKELPYTAFNYSFGFSNPDTSLKRSLPLGLPQALGTDLKTNVPCSHDTCMCSIRGTSACKQDRPVSEGGTALADSVSSVCLLGVWFAVISRRFPPL